jgi:hypothetical protein
MHSKINKFSLTTHVTGSDPVEYICIISQKIYINIILEDFLASMLPHAEIKEFRIGRESDIKNKTNGKKVKKKKVKVTKKENRQNPIRLT